MDETRTWKKTISPEQAHVKIRHYCAFQERAHQEVKMKLSTYGLSWSDANQIISKLIEDGFLNEERFAKAFVGGKFRIKGWGNTTYVKQSKTRQYLLSRGFENNIISNAMKLFYGKTDDHNDSDQPALGK